MSHASIFGGFTLGAEPETPSPRRVMHRRTHRFTETSRSGPTAVGRLTCPGASMPPAT